MMRLTVVSSSAHGPRVGNAAIQLELPDSAWVHTAVAIRSGFFASGAEFGEPDGTNAVLKFHSDGALDPSFSLSSPILTEQGPAAAVSLIVPQADGRILVADLKQWSQRPVAFEDAGLVIHVHPRNDEVLYFRLSAFR